MILIVDDDPSVAASLGMLLRQAGHESVGAGSADEAERVLGSRDVALVLQDMNFSRMTTGEEGLDLLRRIKALRPAVPVVLMTAWGSIELAVEGMKRGAADFVAKPWTNAHLLRTIETALALSRAPAPAPSTRRQIDERLPATALVGEDPKLLRVLELAARAAPTDASVLVTGESGTGKELLAEAIHGGSRRSGGPFVKVNLGGISSTLLESEMFGHVRGAFTDARAQRRGRFEVAHGGTIFLDEIGELELASQVKLLRVLQDRTYEPLGSSETATVDVRVVSATNRDVEDLVRRGAFREDLLSRLNLIHLRLPPLRERAGDVPAIARSVLARLAAEHGRPETGLTPRALAWLSAQPWPGNVRQLRQAIERAVVLLDEGELDAPALAALAEAETEARASGARPLDQMTLDEAERELVTRCLRRHGGNVTRTAEALGISRPALYRRLERHGLDKAAE